jgi:methylthioribose-1-phosphate isomerase
MNTSDALAVHPDNAVVRHDDRLYLLDQRILPGETRFVACNSAVETAQAITDMVVRGAPAIGITAAYGVVLARHHGVGFMVAAPTSTIDMGVASGAEIPSEERNPDEVLACGGKRIGPEGVPAHNPVFDVTPAALVDCIVTERGVVRQPDTQKMRARMGA